MQTIFKLPDSLEDDLNKFRENVERFGKGEISAAEFRSFRVPLGVYEQRKDGTFMLRVRFPAGGVLPHQMRTLAGVSRKYGSGVLHVTTRQDIQVHNVELEGIHPALVKLYGAGLSTKGGGGNTVRNITACYDSGVCPKEAFDVTPYSIAVTEFLLDDPLSYRLPRKYKIAFSGCAEDCAGATLSDVGFIAKKQDGEPGFAVYVGGGMGAKSRVADLLEEFVPAQDAHFVAEAVKRVFDKHGDRKNKHKARLRFLVERMGPERFRTLYEDELSKLRQKGLPPLHVRDLPGPGTSVPKNGEPPEEGFREWREKNTTAQKQSGYRLVHIPLVLGDIDAGTFEKLADVVEAHGEGIARTTQLQNLVLRSVHDRELAALHRKLGELGLAETFSPIARNAIACTGASTCRLGICLSRGLSCAVIDELTHSGLSLDKLGEFNLHVSGCPNACGRHPVGQIGLFGAARRVDGRLVPCYVVQLGGRVGEGITRLARGKDVVPARNVPAFISEFLHAFAEAPQCPDFDVFLEDGGRELAAQLARKHGRIPSFEEDKNCYFDWGSEELFSLAGRGPGECGAGVFDLIEVDLASAREAVEQGRLFAATVLASRALLVTQGEEAGDDAEALELFTKHFIDTGLVKETFRKLTEGGLSSASSGNPEKTFRADAGDVSAMVDAVQKLYDSLDPSLRFRSADDAPASQAEKEAPDNSAPGVKSEEAKVDREENLQGVTCPLNYVKTKLLLGQMAKGQVLAVFLDGDGARNVPPSAEKDGHQVLSVKEEGDRWRVTIRKG
ncbi:MAG: sulfurtransferase TusA family protein [Acidobacteriota bacterium]|nr:MAG: sulfurtransferase TusA family protein [Acidobacteriota bacterium]